MAADKAKYPADPDRRRAGGWRGEGAQNKRGWHIREELLIKGAAEPPVCLVIRCYADFWITTVENWEKS